eukprot:CAMPEP_0177625208 /NCGR_PEP_ID=MMETSP0419_2-20121207/29960_1 /TAXON_ID=582737 /ORGANISM="Tetraselmis sp., Strain GSL018" /LENGTH=148 /DNA_ID=CAMNT_0019126105 /DNA_START=133 /DNA_END=579 /DNA_ORIENTATION=-
MTSMLESMSGFSTRAIMETGHYVSMALGGDLRAFSALRCLKLYLERLGYEGRHALQVGRGALLFMRTSLAAEELLQFAPSQIAAAVLYCDRAHSGCIPLWPTVLARLTGYAGPDEPFFASAVDAVSVVAARQGGQAMMSPVSPLQNSF